MAGANGNYLLSIRGTIPLSDTLACHFEWQSLCGVCKKLLSPHPHKYDIFLPCYCFVYKYANEYEPLSHCALNVQLSNYLSVLSNVLIVCLLAICISRGICPGHQRTTFEFVLSFHCGFW